MGLIVTRIQPQGAVRIGWRNPLTAGLTGLFHAPAGIRELVSGKLFTRASGGPSATTNPRGISARFSGTPNLSVALPTVSAPMARTVFALVKSASIAGGIHAVSTLSGSGGNAALMQCNGANWFDYTYLASTTPGTTETSGVAVDRLEIVCGTWDGTTATLYRGGKVVGTPNASVIGPSRPINQWIVGTGFIGDIELVAYWQARCLSAAEVADLTRNPWQLFEPAPRRIWRSTVYQRALYLNAGAQVGQIPDASLGTGLKPLVWDGAQVKQRSTTEGTPLVLVDGALRLLQAGETLQS